MSRINFGIAAVVFGAGLSLLAISTPRIVRAAPDASHQDDQHEPQGKEDSDAHDAGGPSKERDGGGKGDAEHGDEATPEEKAELKFDEQAQRHLGIICEPAKAGSAAPSIRALGVVVEDESRTFTLRAPLGGYLRSSETAWPAVGDTIADHAVVAALQPRLTPVERFALENQVTDARAAVAEIETEQAAAEASYESKRKLNEEGKVVSDRQFEEADGKLRLVRARLSGARAKLEQLQGQISAVERGLTPLPLHVDQGGTVLEVLAAPGEAVESGQPLLRVLVPGKALVRIELPLGATWSPMATGIRVAPLTEESAAQEATLVGPAPRVGPQTRGQAWLLRTADSPALAPGAPLTARLPLAGEPITGVLAPADAILRYGGLTWVFVREGEQIFERQAVRLIEPTPDGWLVQGDLEPGAPIVTHAAQLLLSEQLKAQIEAEAEAGE